VEIPLGRADVTHFADGEIYVEIGENVRGVNCFVVQSTCTPVNQSLMELLIMIDALRRASAGSIVAVIPYFGYARQDRKPSARTPISAKLVANLISHAGADRVLTLDLHAGQIQGFFDIPTDNLYSVPVITRDIKAHHDIKDVIVVSPDVGGVVRARALAKRLDAPLAIVDKRRERAGEAEVMNVIGDVTGRRCILFDDIVDSGGTLVNAAQALTEKGVPLMKLARLVIRQPPRRAEAARFCEAQRFPGPKGSSQVPVIEKLCVRSKPSTIRFRLKYGKAATEGPPEFWVQPITLDQV